MKNQLRSKNSVIVGKIALALSLIVCGSQAPAQIFTLTNNNSSATINVGSSAGMSNWSVDGKNYLSQQWFWFRVGNASPEAPINTISAATANLVNNRLLTSSYYSASQNFGISISYLLTGFSPGSATSDAISDIAEGITITNGGTQTLSIDFFQYSDFNLGGINGDAVGLGTNLHGLYNEAYQVNGLVALTETVVTPGANRGEASSGNLTLTKLNDAVADNLNNATFAAGPTNATWALQWHFDIAPGASVGISKDKYLDVYAVPEPTALSLAGIGIAFLAAAARRKK